MLGDAFDNIEAPETPEQVDEFLCDAGYDPDEVGRQTAAFVDELISGVRMTCT